MPLRKLKNIAGRSFPAIGWNIFIVLAILVIEVLISLPEISLPYPWHIIVALILLVPYIIIITWSSFTISNAKQKRLGLITSGIFGLVRHPIYSGIIFLLNPALAIIFKSWLYLAICIPIGLIWNYYVNLEEKDDLDEFGRSYLLFCEKVPKIFPRLKNISYIFKYILKKEKQVIKPPDEPTA